LKTPERYGERVEGWCELFPESSEFIIGDAVLTLSRRSDFAFLPPLQRTVDREYPTTVANAGTRSAARNGQRVDSPNLAVDEDVAVVALVGVVEAPETPSHC
jgi:hypothetical protein